MSVSTHSNDDCSCGHARTSHTHWKAAHYGCRACACASYTPTHSDGYEEERLAGTPRPVIAQAGEAIPAGAMVQIGADGRLELLDSRHAQEHYTDVLTAARWKNALETIAKQAQDGLATRRAGKVHALYAIRDAAKAALQEPAVGTRVRCLLPHRGEFGEVVAWDRDLGRPLVHWDSDEGGATEAVEPHEYTTDLNEVD
jgi:hypothetical protein